MSLETRKAITDLTPVDLDTFPDWEFALDEEAAVETLQEIPSDLRHWTVQNSQRPDVEIDAEAGRFGEAQSRRVLPAYERPLMKWNGNPYRLDGGDGGRTEEDGTFFLLPYWMGRCHGLFEEG